MPCSATRSGRADRPGTHALHRAGQVEHVHLGRHVLMDVPHEHRARPATTQPRHGERRQQLGVVHEHHVVP